MMIPLDITLITDRCVLSAVADEDLDRGENPKGFMKQGEWVAEGEYYLDLEQFKPSV